MAVTGEANRLLDVVIKATSICQKIRAGWFKATQDVESFPVKVEILKTKEEEMRDLLKSFGMCEMIPLRLKLENIRNLMDSVELEVQELEKSRYIVRLLREINFPGELTFAIEDVNQEIQNISQSVDEMKNTTHAFDELFLSQPSSLPFSKDSRYVPMMETITTVKHALESPDIGIVNLYGGPGEGKTSLAEYLALSYSGDLNVEASSASFIGFSDGVFFYRCGPKADSKGILYQFGQDLGIQHFILKIQDDNDDFSTCQTVLPENSLYRSSIDNTRKKLTKRLKNQRILVILDDVWESVLVKDLLIPCEGVKYLLTSQQKEVWREQNCKSIPLCKPSFEEAQQILANHVDLGQEIPKHLENYAQGIIEGCDYNPLKIANVAISIKLCKLEIKEKWKLSLTNLKVLLGGNPEFPPILYRRQYSKPTVESAISMAVDSFSYPSKALLCIASVCDSEVIPEIALMMIFKHLNTSLKFVTFSSSCRDLLRSSFVKLEKKLITRIGDFEIHERAWFIHGERKSFMRDTQKQAIESLLPRIFEPHLQNTNQSQDIEILQALVYLYAEEMWQEKAAHKLNVLFNKDLFQRTRNCIEPFVYMLDVNCDKNWEKQACICIKKVILHYIRYTELDDEAMSQLLMIEEISERACHSLCTMSQLANKPLLTKHLQRTVQALLDLQSLPWDEKSIIFLASAAFGDLVNRACKDKDAMQLVTGQTKTFPTIFKVLHRYLKLPEKESEEISLAQLTAAISLGTLMDITCEWNHNEIKMACLSSGLEEMVPLLSNEIRPSVQEQALNNITCQVHDHKIKVCTIIVETLVAYLASEISPDLQLLALRIILNITEADSDYKIMFPTVSGAIGSLVGFLGNETRPTIQENALRVLQNITVGIVDNKIKVVTCPRALDSLVALLEKGTRPAIHEEALKVLHNITYGVLENKIKLITFPGALDLLVALLSKETSPAIQELALWILDTITFQMVDHKTKVITSQGALEALVALLDKEISPAIYKGALEVLNNITVDVVENKIKVATFPGALDSLVASLGKEFGPAINERALGVLHSIIVGVVENKIKVIAFPGALDALVALLGREMSPTIHERALQFLYNSTVRVVETKIKLAAFPGAAESLVALLGEEVSPTIQKTALGVLDNITQGVVQNKIKVAACSGAVGMLVALLGKEIDPAIHEMTLKVLNNIVGDVLENNIKVASYPGAVDALVALLSKETSLDFQKRALEILYDITVDVVENKIKVATCPDAVGSLVTLLGSESSPDIQEGTLMVLISITYKCWDSKIKVGTYSGAIEALVALLDKKINPYIQELAATALGNIILKGNSDNTGIVECVTIGGGNVQMATDEMMSSICRKDGTWCWWDMKVGDDKDLVTELVSFLSSDTEPALEFQVAKLLTFVDLAKAETILFRSSRGYTGRAIAKCSMGNKQGALEDINLAFEMDQEPDHEMFGCRCFIMSTVENYNKALEDINMAIQLSPRYFYFQERGILKGKMKYFDEALTDLEKAVELGGESYEIIKHRGLVKFQKGDEVGAHLDGELATKMTSSNAKLSAPIQCLGELPVTYLEFRLF